MTGERQRLTAKNFERFEHPVPHGDAMIEHRNLCLISIEEFGLPADLNPHAHRANDVAVAATGCEATWHNRLAFNSVSCHSPYGSEPQVMPAPVPK